MFVGKIIANDTPEEYEAALQFLVKLGMMASLVGFILVAVDRKYGSILYYPENSSRVKNAMKLRD